LNIVIEKNHSDITAISNKILIILTYLTDFVYFGLKKNENLILSVSFNASKSLSPFKNRALFLPDIF